MSLATFELVIIGLPLVNYIGLLLISQLLQYFYAALIHVAYHLTEAGENPGTS
jgi:hypothetical protein